jgi:hypothetical protein
MELETASEPLNQPSLIFSIKPPPRDQRRVLGLCLKCGVCKADSADCNRCGQCVEKERQAHAEREYARAVKDGVFEMEERLWNNPGRSPSKSPCFLRR